MGHFTFLTVPDIIPEFSEGLSRCITAPNLPLPVSYHQGITYTKGRKDAWKANQEMLPKVLSWLADATGLDLEHLETVDPDRIWNVFSDCVNFRAQKQEMAVENTLGRLQSYVVGQHSHIQRNVFLETNPIPEYHDQPDLLEEPESFHSATYLKLGKGWNQILEKHITVLRDDNDSTIPFKEASLIVGKMLQAMRGVKKRTYQDPTFLKAMGASGLLDTIAKICEPGFAVQTLSPHAPGMRRNHRLAESLGEILQTWAPEHEVAQWLKETSTEIFVPNPRLGDPSKVIDKPAALLRAFKDHPSLMPNESDPQALYFFFSLNNFLFAWHRWLGPCLEALNYRINISNDKLQDFYSLLVQLLLRICPDSTPPQGYNKYLGSILARSAQIIRLKKTFKDGSYTQSLSNCSECRNLSPEKRCTTKVVFPHRFPHRNDPNHSDAAEYERFMAKYQGCGISKVPQGSQMKSVPVTDKNDVPISPTKVYHPDELDLKAIRPDPDIVKRCKHHTFLIYENAKDARPRDFVLYFAFEKPRLESLISHARKVSGVSPVSRGIKFRHWSNGTMKPWGSRVANGGRLGDTYTGYAGMTGSTVEGLDILFGHAEAAIVYRETARRVHPDLVKALEAASDHCDRVGISGANLFDCSGYIAPQHTDEDVAQGLSACLEHKANDAYAEFAFCSLAFGYYIVTQGNMLWSFDSAHMHGTMLPSQKTLEAMHIGPTSRLRGGADATVSTGQHQTTRTVDAERAKVHSKVRQTYRQRTDYFRQFC
ncbi:hypothetical protein C8J56DRAFT_1125018 [Mycena floridula]|nr:hypothetical protein C8J56DRAFT_1125018 [Mycena floridula]